jgi:3-oxoacyl-[acyl-carrier-protein] synthase II
MKKRIVITGMGAITPLGNSLQATWEAVVSGRSGIGPVTLFDASTLPVRIAGEVKGFTCDDSAIPQDMRNLPGRSAFFCLSAAREALQDAGLDMGCENPLRVGISLGADEETQLFHTINKLYDQPLVLRALAGGLPLFVECLEHSSLLGKLWSFKRRADIATKLLAITCGMQGPADTSHTACSSSGHAIGKAKRMIENDDCDVVIAGGHCAMISEFSAAGFHLLGTLSTRNDEPQRASRPFDRDRDGFVIGEGAGLLVLEELDHARRRGARIYGELAGYGSSSNSYRLTDTPPDGKGGDIAMHRALEDAGLDASAVGYINAHGTATLLNDRSETLAIKHVFGHRAYKIPVSSSKSMIGHLVCASSAAELIITVMAVKENIIPPTINLEHPDPLCDLDYVPNTARKQELDVALSNSFAFGGQNATLVVVKFKD